MPRARPLSFFGADTDGDTDIFALLKLQLKGIAVHFFFWPHKQKNNYSSYK